MKRKQASKPAPKSTRSRVQTTRKDRKPPRSAQGRPSLSKQDRAVIRDRLWWYYREYRQYTSQRQFAQAAVVPESTISDWLHPQSRVPDLANLLTFARNEGISLDWLLLGRGSPALAVSRTIVELADDLRAYVVNELARGDWAAYRNAIKSRLPLAPELLAKVPEAYRAGAAAYIDAYHNMIITNRREALIELLDSPPEDEEHAFWRRQFIDFLKARGDKSPVSRPGREVGVDPDITLQDLPPKERKAAWERRRQSQERVIKRFGHR